jgi:hypothetical protein
VDLLYETTVQRPYESVAQVLRRDPARWLPGAERAGEALLFEVGVGAGQASVRRRVRVSLGSVHPFGYGLAVPIAWRAAAHAELYPTLEATIRLERTERLDRCRLRLDGTYRPPGGRLGVAVDQALMRRVADASLRDFLERLSAGLEREADGHDAGRLT